MVELLADMLLRPKLDADELTKLRERAINFIRVGKDTNLNALLPIYGHAFLFGEHPYGNPVGGSETSLANIAHADILDFYEQQVGADHLIVSVSVLTSTQQACAQRLKRRSAHGGPRPASWSMFLCPHNSPGVGCY